LARAAADKDLAALAKLDEKALIELSLATETGLTPEAYRALAATWLARTHHPKLATPYQRLVYQPQLELLAYLRAHGFRTYIVSGGDVEFMRAFAENTYGVPPEQVIGSSQKAAYALTEGRAEVTFRPELGSLDDGPGKPVNIALHIGRRPVIAVGNSDGDLAMLQYVAGRAGPSLAVLVHHDDDTREYAYDRASHIGRLDKALDEARERKWTIVSMKSDWRTVFPRP
jgi:phosphoserine phosphatase